MIYDQFASVIEPTWVICNLCNLAAQVQRAPKAKT